MVKLPKQIKIGAIIYKVTKVDMDCCGEVDRRYDSIKIKRDLSKGNQGKTLLHEIFHELNGELPEPVIESLAAGWHQVIEDNGLWK